jgi:hypothetical protein
MKNLLIAAIAVFTIGANAQDVIKSKKGETYLPEKGDWAIGFNADGIFKYLGNSFNGNTGNSAPSVTYNKDREGTFVGKKFITDKKAYRVIANFQVGSSSETLPQPRTTILLGPNDVNTTDINRSSFALTAGLGKEWRRGKTRLQGYYGADLLLSISNSSNKVASSTTTTVGTTITNSFNDVETKNGLGFGIGAQGFLGAEYFIFPKMAIGAQYTYGIGLSLAGKAEETTTNGATGSPNTSTTVSKGSNTTFGVGGVGVTSINLTLHF